jgi:hypothetical protein
MKNSPIIFIHTKKSNFLIPAIYQAKQSNPDSPIYIISDIRSKSFYEPHANFIDIAKYFTSSTHFEKIYTHLNSNSYTFELICMQRWFILNEVMKEMGLDNIVMLDSDCLLYTDISKEWQMLEGFDLGLVNINCPAVTFIKSQHALESFCNYMYEEYSRNLDNLKLKYQNNFVDNAKLGGICDMTHLNSYNEKFNTIFDLSRINNNSTYDVNIRANINSANIPKQLIDEADGYIRNSYSGFKAIYWKNGIPYCKLVQNKKEIQFKSLHFQGNAKKKMAYFFQGNYLQKLGFIKTNFYERLLTIKRFF